MDGTPPPPPRGCMMTQGLYLKANLEMPCWDDAGEGLVLRRLDPARLAAGEERDLLGFPALRRLRDSFRAGRAPHPGLCARCAARGHGARLGEAAAWRQALALDPGFPAPLPPGDPLDWPGLATRPRQVATARALATRAHAAGRADLARALRARLRDLAPDGTEAQAARREEALEAALAALDSGRPDQAEDAAARALGPGPEGGWLADLSPAPAPDPATAALLANLAWRLRDLRAARQHFRRYLSLAPAATDRAAVEAALADIEARLADAEGSAGAPAAAIAGAPAAPPQAPPAAAADAALREENARLKRLLAEALLELDRLRNP